MKSSPLAVAKKRFGIDEKDPAAARKAVKEKLVAELEKFTQGGLWLDRVKGAKGLAGVSNRKLLGLLDSFTKVQETFGSRDAMIAEIVKLEGRTDETYKTRFAHWPTPRLWDHYRAAKRRAKN